MSSERLSNAPITSDDFFPQLWLLLVSLMVFGAYVAWERSVFALIFAIDRSYMASLTMALVVVMSAHCGWHVIVMAQRARSARRCLAQHGSMNGLPSSVFLQHFIGDLTTTNHDSENDTDAIVEIHADSVRAPAELGWFFVDLAVRLGLLGTIIGFILIFASLDNISIDGGDDLKQLLIAMSGGMGTALYTTLTGLVGASLLSFQYLVLGRQSEHLIGLLLRIRRCLQVPTDSANQMISNTSLASVISATQAASISGDTPDQPDPPAIR